jgi:hypothetical protein
MNARTLAAALALLCAPAAAGDEPDARPVGLLLRLGFDFGGDTVARAKYEDGSDKRLQAGQLVSVAGGLIYHPRTVPVAAEATFGHKADRADGSKGRTRFTRYPVDLVVSCVVADHVRLGLGPTLHLSPRLSCDVGGQCAGSVGFANAWGGIIQAAFGVPIGDSGLDLGARYTRITYRSRVAGAPAVDGSSFGVFLGGWI